MIPPPRFLLTRKFLTPLLTAVVLGIALYFGGRSYQLIGLAALDRLREVLGYGLGIAEISVLGVLVHRFIRYIILDNVVARALGTPVPGLLVQLSGLVVVVTAAAATFGIVFHQDLTVLWAASGVLGFVFGMALKDMILDVFTGIALNLDRPIRIGDRVQLHRTGDQVVEGKVLEISWRATRLLDDFGNVVIVPNSRLGVATITNFSEPEPWCWIVVPVTLDPEVPPARAVRILEAAAVEGLAALSEPSAPAPWVGAKALTASGIEYSVCASVPVDKRQSARDAVVRQVWQHLTRAGLQPSWPKQERREAPPTVGSPAEVPTPAQVAHLLAATPLLQDLAPSLLEAMAAAARARVFPPGAVLVQAGESAAALYLILEGLVVVEAARARRPAPSARLEGPGALVGALATLTADAYPETFRCRTAVRAAELDHPALNRLLLANPTLAPLLSHRLAQDLPPTQRLGAIETAEDVLAAIRQAFPEVGAGGCSL